MNNIQEIDKLVKDQLQSLRPKLGNTKAHRSTYSQRHTETLGKDKLQKRDQK